MLQGLLTASGKIVVKQDYCLGQKIVWGHKISIANTYPANTWDSTKSLPEQCCVVVNWNKLQ